MAAAQLPVRVYEIIYLYQTRYFLMKQIIFLQYLILLPTFLLYLYVTTVFSQDTLTTKESYILRLIDEENAFQSWQSKWHELLPSFNLTKFRFQREIEIAKEYAETASLDSLLGTPLLAFLTFSPNGYLAVSSSPSWIIYKKEKFYRVGYDDGMELRLYDFRQDESYRILYSGLYGPAFNGFAWLNDNFLIAVGAIWQLARNHNEQDKVAPAVMSFDFEGMRIRFFKGDYLEALKYYGNRPGGLSIETKLMFKFQPPPRGE